MSRVQRAFRENVKAVVALLLLWVSALAVGGYIVAHQRIHPPSWIPVVGEKTFTIKARLTSVQGVLPGQGQAVTVSGVQVGDIRGVDLVDGLGVATLKLRPEDAPKHIYPNATVLLRPKTGLKDMVAELDPGDPSSGPALKDGATLSEANTNPDVNFDEILASLDRDGRDMLRTLVGNGAEALGDGGGEDLASTVRRFEPLSRYVAQATSLVEERHDKLKRLMTNLSQIAVELGSRDKQLSRFVQGSEGSLRRFAAQSTNIAKTVQLLPGALESSNTALSKVKGLGDMLHTTLTELDPTAKALGPSQAKLQPFFRATTPVLKDSLRPFAREAQPTVKLLVPAAHDLAIATPQLRTFTNVLNALFDELAYDPPGDGKGQQSTLFYLPWAVHNTNSTLANQDGVGPVRRSLIGLGCSQMDLLESLTQVPKGQTESRNPTLKSIIELLNAPDYASLIQQGKCPDPTKDTGSASK